MGHHIARRVSRSIRDWVEQDRNLHGEPRLWIANFDGEVLPLKQRESSSNLERSTRCKGICMWLGIKEAFKMLWYLIFKRDPKKDPNTFE